MTKRSKPQLKRERDPRTGRVLAEGPLEAGERNGGWLLWYPSGECRAMGEYASGNEDGPWRYWYQNGQLAAQGEYDDGAEQGEWTYWHESGGVLARGTYQRGRVHGRWMRRTVENVIWSVEEWNDGALVRRLVLVPEDGLVGQPE